MGYRDHASAAAGQRQPTTRDGITIEPVYTRSDIAAIHQDQDIGEPGSYPFTRGIFTPASRPHAWRAEQYAGYGSASDTKERFDQLNQAGMASMAIALDMPTQLGLDSDHPLAAGEVGRVGVAIDSLADVEELFGGRGLGQIGHIFSTANSIGPVILAMILAVAEKQEVDPATFTVQLQNDSLKEYFARGTQIFPVKDALRLSADTIEYCARHLPEWSPLSISGAHMRGAGATALQELAFTICDGVAYVEEVVKRGVDIDDFASNLELHFAIQMDVFEEVARLRAARRIWAKLMKNRFGAKRDESMAAWITTATSGITLTAQEPLNNVIRTTTETIAALIGGANNHRVASYDEALSIPTADAAKVAVRIPQILAYESRLGATADPLGGSYFVEALTTDFETRFWDEFQRVEDRGGAVAAIEDGYFFKCIVDSALQFQEDMEADAVPVVGVNLFVDAPTGAPPTEVFEGSPDTEVQQIERLNRVRAQRNDDAVVQALEALRAVSSRGENVVPAVLDAVRVYATIGEICDIWRELFGDWDRSANAL
jgi:methylmalonyl-CoA mutase N-terminal domain/subunit